MTNDGSFTTNGGDADIRPLVAANADGILVCELDGRVRYANPAAARLLGRSPAELAGVDLGVPLRPGAVTQIDLVVDERLLVAELHAVELEWEGRPAILGSLRDVTARKLAESELRRAHRGLEAMIEAAPVAIVHLDREGRVLSWNDAAELMLGWTEEELLGRPCPLLPDGVEPPGAERPPLEFTVRSRDGRAVDVSLHTGAVADDAGEPAGVILVALDISARKRRDERVQYLAAHDPLTGLANRRVLGEELERAVERRRERGRRAGDGRADALLILDLDRFKEVNDSAGHLAGDELLTRVARTVRAGVRPEELSARYGGDELAVLLRDVSPGDARLVAERLREQVSAQRLVSGGRTFQVGVSIGGAVVDGGLDARSALALADLALARAKAAGRGRCLVLERAEPESSALAEEGRWSELIGRALTHDGFVVDLLPLVALRSGEEIGCEALVRLPDGDAIHQPASFLGRADAAGLLAEIDAWMTARALALLADPAHAPVSVNLSAAGLGHRPLHDLVAAADPPRIGRRLGFEVDEQVLLGEPVRSRTHIDSLRARGCTFSLDGVTGRAGALLGLDELPVETLKLHPGLLGTADGAGADADAEAVRSIVAAARAAGRRVVAVGLETDQARRRALALGVELGQGFLWPAWRAPRPEAPDRVPA